MTNGKSGYITKYDFYSHPQQIHYLFQQIIFLKSLDRTKKNKGATSGMFSACSSKFKPY